MKMRLKLVSFFRPFLGLLLAIALTTASPLANPTPGLVRAFELSSPLGDSIANTPLLDGVAKNKTTNQKSKLKPIKHTELSEHFSVIPESLKVAFPPEESNEPNGKSNPIVKFCEHLMGVKTPKKPKSARAILARTAASLQDTPSKASKKSKEVSNGLNEQPSSNPIVKLWKKLVGEKEKEEVNIEDYYPIPYDKKAWEGIANKEINEKKRNIFQRFWNWVKSFFPCLKKKDEYRIYGEDGFWTNQRSADNDDYIPYPLRHDYYKMDRVYFGSTDDEESDDD